MSVFVCVCVYINICKLCVCEVTAVPQDDQVLQSAAVSHPAVLMYVMCI